MPKTVIISIGHGKNTWEDKKSKGVIMNGVVFMEHTFNAIVGMKVKTILEAHGVNVVLVQQPNAQDVPLSTRTSKAKQIKPDLYWSIHANAGSNQGMAAFHWSTDPKAEKAAVLYAKFAKEAGLTLYSDGSYPSVANTWNDFHELRVNKNNGIVAVLTENGFMTHPEDFKRIFLNKDDFHNVISRVNAKAILAYLGITFKEEKPTEIKKEEKDLNEVETTNLIKKVLAEEAKKRQELNVSEWAEKEWKEAISSGYVDGENPRDYVTKETAVVMDRRVINNIKKYVADPLEKRIKELEDKLKGAE